MAVGVAYEGRYAYLPMKMEQSIPKRRPKIQRPWNYPGESMQQERFFFPSKTPKLAMGLTHRPI